MTATELAVEHLRMTVLSATATGTRQAVVITEELAVLLGEYDRLSLHAAADRRAAQGVRAEWEAGRHQSRECEGCGCCNAADCHRGPDSRCPSNSIGESVCPCTED